MIYAQFRSGKKKLISNATYESYRRNVQLFPSLGKKKMKNKVIVLYAKLFVVVGTVSFKFRHAEDSNLT